MKYTKNDITKGFRFHCGDKTEVYLVSKVTSINKCTIKWNFGRAGKGDTSYDIKELVERLNQRTNPWKEIKRVTPSIYEIY